MPLRSRCIDRDVRLGLAVLAVAVVPSLGLAASGAKRGDESLSCAALARELQRYIAPMRPNVTALNATNQELVRRNKRRMQEAAPLVAAGAAAATASSLDPTGISGRVLGQTMAAAQQQIAEQALNEDRPLADQQRQQADLLMQQALQAQSDPRLMRLLELGREKGCDRQQ